MRVRERDMHTCLPTKEINIMKYLKGSLKHKREVLLTQREINWKTSFKQKFNNKNILINSTLCIIILFNYYIILYYYYLKLIFLGEDFSKLKWCGCRHNGKLTSYHVNGKAHFKLFLIFWWKWFEHYISSLIFSPKRLQSSSIFIIKICSTLSLAKSNKELIFFF